MTLRLGKDAPRYRVSSAEPHSVPALLLERLCTLQAPQFGRDLLPRYWGTLPASMRGGHLLNVFCRPGQRSHCSAASPVLFNVLPVMCGSVGTELQVLQPIIQFVVVDVVNDRAWRDGTVGLLPDPAVVVTPPFGRLDPESPTHDAGVADWFPGPTDGFASFHSRNLMN